MAPTGLIIVRPLAWECASPCRLDSMPRHCKSTTTHTAVYRTQCLSAYAVAAATVSEVSRYLLLQKTVETRHFSLGLPAPDWDRQCLAMGGCG